MPYLIGTDEAGYGPNLGPLVIGATAWHVPDDLGPLDLYPALGKAVCATPRNARDPRLVVADSKVLYSPGKGLAKLERGVLAALSVARGSAANPLVSGADLWRHVDPIAHEQPSSPWPFMTMEAVPVDATAASVADGAKCLLSAFEETGIRLEAVRCRAVFPSRFNELTAKYGNKAEALSRVTLELARALLRELEPGPALILCDRHGGRTRYGGLLQECFFEHFVEVRLETPATSHYRWGPPECRVQAEFHVGGESFLPIALASMTAKYLRELSMRAFNNFWCAQVPNLRPTAGYPHDARRFKAEIAAAQAALGIDDHILWRNR